MLKQLYDTTKIIEKKIDDPDNDALPELIVKDFDEEQIWQELELQNASRIKLLSSTIQNFTNSDLIFLNLFTGIIFFFKYKHYILSIYLNIFSS